MYLESLACAVLGGREHMVRSDGTERDQRAGAFGVCLPEVELELANLVAAVELAGKVVALDP